MMRKKPRKPSRNSSSGPMRPCIRWSARAATPWPRLPD